MNISTLNLKTNLIFKNYEGFHELCFCDDVVYADYDFFCWNGEPRLKGWKAPRIEWLIDDFYSEKNSIPNITTIDEHLVISESTRILFELVLQGDDTFKQVEFLPLLLGESQRWYLVNVLNFLDIMIEEKSIFKIRNSGKKGVCEHPYLITPEDNYRIFKVKGCEGYTFINDVLKTFIESSGLNGVLMRKHVNP